jgi:dihydropteroate synthase
MADRSAASRTPARPRRRAGPAGVTGLDRADEVGEKVAAARGVGHASGDRLEVMAVPSRLVDAAGRVGGAGSPTSRRGRRRRGHRLARWRPRPRHLRRRAAADRVAARRARHPERHPRLVLRRWTGLRPGGPPGGGHRRRACPPRGGCRRHRRRRRVDPPRRPPWTPTRSSPGSCRSSRRSPPTARRLVDTVKAAVARAAVAAGAAIVNDVSSGHARPGPAADRRRARRPLRGDPPPGRTPDDAARPHLRRRRRRGVRPPRRTVRDLTERRPRRASGSSSTRASGSARRSPQPPCSVRSGELTSLGRPVLVGASRKGFLGTLTGVDDPTDRLEGSLASRPRRWPTGPGSSGRTTWPRPSGGPRRPRRRRAATPPRPALRVDGRPSGGDVGRQ